MLARTSAFQNIIYYSIPDVVDRERVGRQGDKVDTICVLLGPLLNIPRASFVCEMGIIIPISSDVCGY